MKHFVVGAGSYGEVILELASECGVNVDGVIDDNPELHGQRISGVPVVSRFQAADNGLDGSLVAIAVGSWHVRREFARWLDVSGASPSTLVHPGAYVAPSVELGRGCIVHRDAFVWTGTRLGAFVILSPGSRVAHHTTLGDFSFVSMGAAVGAGMELGEGALVGMGATVMTGVKRVGRRAVVGAGAVVTRDVRDDAIVVGVPARELPEKRETG